VPLSLVYQRSDFKNRRSTKTGSGQTHTAKKKIEPKRLSLFCFFPTQFEGGLAPWMDEAGGNSTGRALVSPVAPNAADPYNKAFDVKTRGTPSSSSSGGGGGGGGGGGAVDSDALKSKL
jgi:hypothetical protein